MTNPLERLRYHVTGAIDRGEAEAITAIYQEAVSDRADELVAEAMANGEPFSEGLTNWAIDKALREVSK